MMQAIVYEYDYGISCIDTMYVQAGYAACYLMVHNGRAAFIDTGTGSTVPYLLEVLKQKNLCIEDVEYVIPTHVHLDHAGGAGLLMSKLPNAKLVIHPRGAAHMVNPQKLIIGATAVYGEDKFKQYFGAVLPIDEQRIIVAEDNHTLELAGRALRFIDTPGHARHHFCIYDHFSEGFFTGDTFGLSYRQLDDKDGAFILPTTSPVQFEPDAWQNSLTRLLSFNPKNIYLTHFGRVTEVKRLAQELRSDINQYAEIAQNFLHADDRRNKIVHALTEFLQQRLSNRNVTADMETQARFLKPDLELNAAGLEAWLDRQLEAA